MRWLARIAGDETVPLSVLRVVAELLTFGLALGTAIARAEKAPHREIVQKGCATGAVCVGPNGAYASLAAALSAAKPGQVVEIETGRYRESVRIAVPGLTVRGLEKGAHIDCAGIALVRKEACLLIAAPGIVLENLEISGAVLSAADDANGACIRNEHGASFTLRKIVCHSSQDGLLASGGEVIIESSEFYDNGWDGLTHNVYLGDCSKVTVRDSVFRDARVGHEFKSRCRKTAIYDSVFVARHGSRALDLPDGGDVIVEGGTIFQGEAVQNENLIGYAAESCKYPGGMILRGVHIVSRNPNGSIRNYGRCSGAVITLIGVTYEGPPLHLIGEIRTLPLPR